MMAQNDGAGSVEFYGLPDEQAAVGACRQKLYVKEVAVLADYIQSLHPDGTG